MSKDASDYVSQGATTQNFNMYMVQTV